MRSLSLESICLCDDEVGIVKFSFYLEVVVVVLDLLTGCVDLGFQVEYHLHLLTCSFDTKSSFTFHV